MIDDVDDSYKKLKIATRDRWLLTCERSFRTKEPEAIINIYSYLIDLVKLQSDKLGRRFCLWVNWYVVSLVLLCNKILSNIILCHMLIW